MNASGIDVGCVEARKGRRPRAGSAAIAADRLTEAARALARGVGRLRFHAPVAYVYNPLDYAWEAHVEYLRRYGGEPKRVLFVGMNPGPFGMMQTGVPFGEVTAVRDWLGITAAITPPARCHPKRPVQGFDCSRSEVSGRRLWGLFRDRFGIPERFFADHFVANYCPLAFLDSDGRNVTPDKLPARVTARLFAACDAHLRALATAFEPAWVIGIGDFAARRARLALDLGTAGPTTTRFGQILHPSPASPAANRDWPGAAARQLGGQGVW